MKRTLVLGAALLAAMGAAAPAGAVIISFVPSSSTVDVGDLIDIEVQVSDLTGEIVSAYDLDVNYDPSIVDATGVAFGPFLGDSTLFEVIDGFVLSPGTIDFFAVSLLSDAELVALQTDDPFVLATLSFVAIAPGTTSLVFDPVTFPGIDVKGRGAEPIFAEPVDGSITVRERTQVSEPSLLWLGLAVAAGALYRRRSGR